MRFNTKIIPTGGAYGRDNCLTNHDEPMIEFYDPRYQHTPHGQFISRYNVSTIMDHTGGLWLYGGVDEWTVSQDDMREIRVWLHKLEIAA